MLAACCPLSPIASSFSQACPLFHCMKLGSLGEIRPSFLHPSCSAPSMCHAHMTLVNHCLIEAILGQPMLAASETPGGLVKPDFGPHLSFWFTQSLIGTKEFAFLAIFQVFYKILLTLLVFNCSSKFQLLGFSQPWNPNSTGWSEVNGEWGREIESKTAEKTGYRKPLCATTNDIITAGNDSQWLIKLLGKKVDENFG